jgi:hypothetical protein
MEKIIENQESNNALYGRYKNFLHSNFQETIISKYSSLCEEELEREICTIVIDGFKSNLNTPILNFNFIEFSDAFIEALGNIKEDTIIESVIFATNTSLDKEDFLKIADLLSKVKTLTDLYVYNSKLEGKDLLKPVNQIIKSVGLQTFLLSKQIVGNQGFEYMIEKGLLLNNTLIELTFSNLDIDYNGFDVLGLYLSLKDTLKQLSIYSCNLRFNRPANFEIDSYDNKDISEIRKDTCSFLLGLKKNKSIEKLTIIDCGLGSETSWIMHAISKNPESVLRNVDFSQNAIKADDFKIVLEMSKQTNIKSILLNSNSISDLGIFHLYDYLASTFDQTKRIEFLELEDNNISDKGAEILINAINMNYFYLTKLGLAYNTIGGTAITNVAKALVEFSKRNEENMGVEFDKIFLFSNIGQFSIDLIRNGTMNDEEYFKAYQSIIEEEYHRFFRTLDNK